MDSISRTFHHRVRSLASTDVAIQPAEPEIQVLWARRKLTGCCLCVGSSPTNHQSRQGVRPPRQCLHGTASEHFVAGAWVFRISEIASLFLVVVRISLFLCLLSSHVTNFVTYTQVCFISTPDEAELASTLGLDVLGTHPELQYALQAFQQIKPYGSLFQLIVIALIYSGRYVDTMGQSLGRAHYLERLGFCFLTVQISCSLRTNWLKRLLSECVWVTKCLLCRHSLHTCCLIVESPWMFMPR